MSARYSTSSALQLRIARSPLRAALYGALCLVTAYTLWSLHLRGYTLLALALTLPVTGLLWRLRHDPGVGVELCWQQGHWTLERDGVQRGIALSGRCTATRWVIYLAFSELPYGPHGHLWLYADGAPTEQLRRLRVRLTLQR